MLKLKNILEDIVWHMIEDLEESKNGRLSFQQKVEMAAYVLNRMPPLYTTSGRGFVYTLQKHESDPQFQADIWVLLSYSRGIIQRTALGSHEPQMSLHEGRKYYFFPRIYGRVIESRTMAPIESGEVKLFLDGEMAPSYYAKWYNPYRIRSDEGGWYAFAPMPLEATGEEEREFVFLAAIRTAEREHSHSFAFTLKPSVWQAGDEVFEDFFEVSDMYI